ncbi:leiomodin-2-like, partial [Temnothorax curvispinosus]|uniref:Leiomodin-2-like n=1 Tax=Temnothorax curvispinosus TaxID=300111 RepID=A0A6J1R773_9HYME
AHQTDRRRRYRQRRRERRQQQQQQVQVSPLPPPPPPQFPPPPPQFPPPPLQFPPPPSPQFPQSPPHFQNKGRICSVHFEPSCFTKSLQQQLLGYSPRKGRKLRNDAMPTLHLFHKLQVEKTPLLDNSEKTTVALLHVDDVPNAMTNTSMSTVNKSKEPINASPHINDSTDVIDAVVSIDVVNVSSTSIENTSTNTTVAVIGSPAATDLCSPNNDIGYM